MTSKIWKATILTMNEKLKPLFSFVLRFGLSIVLLWLIFYFQKIDPGKILNALKSADLNYIVMAGIVFLAINFILLFRWFIYVRALELTVPLSVVTRYFFIGLFGNLLLPTAIGGDVVKILGLCQYSERSSQKPKVVASVLLDRLSGFAGIVVTAIAAFIFGFQLINSLTLLIAIVLLALLSIFIGALLFNELVFSFCCQIFNRLPKIKQSLMNLHYDIALLKGRQSALYQAVGLSVLAQVIAAIFFFLVGKALHENIALIYFLIFTPLVAVACSLPSIGGLGPREGALGFLLGTISTIGKEAGASIGVSMGLINFFFMVLVGLIGGLVYLFTKDVRPTGAKTHC